MDYEKYCKQRREKEIEELKKDRERGRLEHLELERNRGELERIEFTFPDGKKYQGEYKDKRPHGYGKLTFPDGREFEGSFINGRFYGKVLMHKDGSIYEGQFENGKQNQKWKKPQAEVTNISEPKSKNVMTSKDGSGYEGQINNGYGTMTYPNGDRYSGYFKDGVYHGQGELIGSGNVKFRGEFSNGDFKRGTLELPDGQKFEGEFKDFGPCGRGRYIAPDGSFYDGVFQNGDFIQREEKGSRHIPSRVKRQVWRRDRGRCVNCGSRKNLEFDHIIPFSEGGSNTARNIELLCEECNRKKSNKIG